ncbi:hypothetical protein WA577_002427 [Blastocystis sp. JDR]
MMSDLYSPIQGDRWLGQSAIPSGGQLDVISLQNENKRLREEITSMRSLFANLRDGKFFNNDLIRENLDQKDQIASLSAQLDQKNVQISDMNKQLMDRDNEIERLRNSQNGYSSSWDVSDLQRRVRSLQQELREKDNQIAQLNARVGGTSAYSHLYSQPKREDIQQLNQMLDACKEIGDRMLSAICTTIPEWKNAQADVAEIRGDIVCTFKNVESIFNDLLKLYRNGQFNGVASVRAACLFHA